MHAIMLKARQHRAAALHEALDHQGSRAVDGEWLDLSGIRAAKKDSAPASAQRTTARQNGPTPAAIAVHGASHTSNALPVQVA